MVLGSAYGTGPAPYYVVADGFDPGAAVTALSLFMGNQTLDATSPQPGFARAVRATDAFVEWAFVVNNAGPPFDWTLRLRKNQDATDLATFPMIAGVPGVFTSNFGPWVPVVAGPLTFDAGDAFTLFADGPSKNIVVARVSIRFEELC